MSKTIKCECCGVEFEAKRSDAKCCSKKCSNKMWQEANSEKVKEVKKKWKEANPEKIKEACRKWKRANSEKAKEACRKWKRANSEKAKEVVRRHRYRQAGYPEELLEIKELQYQIKKEIKNQSKGQE